MTPYSPVCLPSHSCSRTPTKGEERSRSQLNSASSTFSQESQPESVTACNPAEDGGDSSTSQDDSESDGEGEVGFDGGASDNGGSSDDENSGSSGSNNGGVTQDEGSQKEYSDKKGKGTGSETEESDAENSSGSSHSDDEDLPKMTPPARKTTKANLNTFRHSHCLT